MVSPAEAYTACDAANRAFIARLRAVSNLVGQREVLDGATAAAVGTKGALVAVSTNVWATGADGAESSREVYPLLVPNASPLGVLGFFSAAPLSRASDLASASVGAGGGGPSSAVGTSQAPPAAAMCGGRNVVVAALSVQHSDSTSTLIGDLANCAADAERAAASLFPSLPTAASKPFTSSTAAFAEIAADANDCNTASQRAQLAQLLLQHASLLTLVAALCAKDCSNEDPIRGARYVLSDAIATARATVCGFFWPSSSSSSSSIPSALPADGPPSIPEELLRLGASYPADVLANVPAFVDASDGIGAAPMLLSEVLGLAADALTVLWPMVAASHPTLAWDLGLEGA